jgi:hypothetical protein
MMSGKEIRAGQLLAPFGPGSIYIDSYGTPLIIGGLDHWMQEYVDGVWENCEEQNEFLISEGRLSELLQMPRFYTPPQYKAVRRNTKPPVNARLKVPVLRFPTWYTNQSGDLVRFTLNTKVLSKGEFWKPVRFIAFCKNGHMTDFPWKDWIKCNCDDDTHLKINDFGGADLNSIRVTCTECRKTKTMIGATSRGSGDSPSTMAKMGIECPGCKPWLGTLEKMDDCKEDLIGGLISQTNLFYAKLISSIFIPPLETDVETNELQKILSEFPKLLAIAKTFWSLDKATMCSALRPKIAEINPVLNYSDEKIVKAFCNLTSKNPNIGAAPTQPSEKESDLLSYRRVENECLSLAISSDPDELRIIPSTPPKKLSKWISKINLIERLRETRVFLGFDRLEPQSNDPDIMAKGAIKQLFKDAPGEIDSWLPATKSYGEGIYIEFDNQKIDEWLLESGKELYNRMDDALVTRLSEHWMILSPLKGATKEWAIKYMLIHSIAHLLIKELVYLCGYSTASLKERLYISNDPTSPMSSILIYTASGDSEGSLGGLVKLGHPDIFGNIFTKAIEKGAWCSTDPVCSESVGAKGSSYLNLTACQACCLLPETACEVMNNGLDRTLVVGTPENRDIGFFSELMNQ